MFEFVRTHNRLLQFLLALLIFPSFVLFGVQGYSRFREGGANTVAVVDGQSITRAEWDAAHQRQVEQMRRRMPTADIKLFDTPQMREATLDALVRERVMLTAVQKLHLGVSDERLQRMFLTDPQFAPLRTADNKINRDFLMAQGLTVEGFEQQLRQDLSMRQVLIGLEGSAIAPDSDARSALDALLQQRELQVQRFDTKDYLPKVNPSDAEIEAFYKAHADQFRAPEQATIEYVVLDLDALKKGITVPEQELRDYYTQNIKRFSTPEERHAAHILVKADKDAPAAERAKAKARAESLLAEVRKNPAAFAELAKKSSDDPGSKDQGGDLGFFAREAMVKPFADAAYTLKPGEISNVVESEFGFHIIKLLETRGGEQKPFEAVRAGIEDDRKKQLAQAKFAEVAEQFTDLVYSQYDSLQPAVDKFKLEKKTATVQRGVPAQAGPLASQKLLEAVFSAESVRNKRNTAAIETGPSQLVSAHVVQHSPAHVQALAEVKDAVRAQLVAEQAAALARKEGQARLAQLKQGGDAAGLGAPVQVSRLQPQGLARPIVEAALRADAGKLPATAGVDLGAEGYAVLRISKVQPPDAASPEVKSLVPRYGQAWGAAEAAAYYNALKARYKTEIKPNAKAEAAAGAASEAQP